MDKGKKLHLHIPQDLSESLGKMPPNATDLEEAVLGALMLERPALAQVIQFLKADHFYSDAHGEIYNAILQLNSEASPVDMRTVVMQLRRTGKIEQVGGAYYIAELTSKVSSAANIEYHARVVVQMAMKRKMIEIASEMHHKAYDHDSDPFEDMDRMEEAFKFFKKNTVTENPETKIRALWDLTLIKEKPEEFPPLLTLDGAPIATPCNHSLIVGKKKSRKTLFIAWLISEYLKQNPNNASRVLLFDTEQGKKHVYMLREKIHHLTDLWVPIFYLRGMSPRERRDFIRSTVAMWAKTPVWVVIDGIRDLMSNINDPDETTEVIVWLEKIILTHNLHITNILHLNKTDNNARGHIGSELLNKAEVTIEMELDEKNGCTIVKCESSREKPFETFAFTHDSGGLPMIVGTPIKGVMVPQDEKRRRLDSIFNDGPIKYKELVDEIHLNFDVSVNRAQKMVAEFTRLGWIIKSGKPRDPTTVYKLMASTNGVHTQKEEKVVQTELKLEPQLETSAPDDLPF